MKNRALRHYIAAATCSLLLASACSGKQSVVAGSQAEEKIEVSKDGQAGFNALRENGCDEAAKFDLEVYEWGGWLPLENITKAANALVEGRVESVSAPRFTSLTEEVPPGGPALQYFRIVDLAVEYSDKYEGESEIGTTVQLLIFGAGPGVEGSNLCFGPDGVQDDREIPLAAGDSVLVIGEYGEFPIVGLDRPALVLTRGLISLWKLEDGTARSVIPAFEGPADAVTERIQLEIDARRDGRLLEVMDDFSVFPGD